MRKPVFGVSTRQETNQAVKPQKLARGLKFWILEVEECSKNKGADHLHGNGAADLRPLFSYMQIAGFLMTRLKYKWTSKQGVQNKKFLLSIVVC